MPQNREGPKLGSQQRNQPPYFQKEITMNKQFHLPPFFGRSLITLVLGAILSIGLGGQAQANIAAGTTILNVVKVQYKDASGTSALFTKSATSTVTVTLLAAAPTITDPTPASGQTIDSGATQAYAYTMYGNANGPDTYDFAVSAGTTPNANALSNNKFIFNYTAPDGTTTATGNTTTTTLANLPIGATVILGDDDVDTISIPAGTLNGIAVGDFVVISGTVYKVRAVDAGTAASYTSGTHTRNDETNGSIQLWQADGITAADFSAVDLAAAVISERWLVDVRVTAVADAAAATDADVYFNLTLTADGAGNPAGVKNDTKTTFRRSQVTVTKAASSANAQTGEVIEYTVTIVVSGSNATSVVVTDSVPEFTTLVSYAGDYNTAATTGSLSTNFAKIADGTTTDLTISTATDAETAVNVGSGNAANYTAGSALNFYLGAGSNGTTGGTVAAGTTYTINYKVKVD